MAELMTASTGESRLALRALFHRILDRVDFFVAGLIEVPEELKTHVFPDRCGMTCYRVTLLGGFKMWVWWDGSQVWEDAAGPKRAT